MSVSVEAQPWDFTPVLNLLHTFTPHEGEGKHQQLSAKPAGRSTNGSPENDTIRIVDYEGESETCRKLGDFGDLFQFLSQVSPPKPKHGFRDVNAVNTRNDDVRGHERFEGIASEAAKAEIPCSSDATAPELLLTTTTTAADADADAAPQEQEQTKPFQPKAILRRKTTNPPAPVTPAKPIKSTAPPARSRLQVESVLTGSAAEKKLDLISKLLQHYATEKSHLQRLKLQSWPSFPADTVTDDGIHVFIDMSNVSDEGNAG